MREHPQRSSGSWSSAILLGAGRGTRIGFDKILTPLAGRPAILHALEALVQAPSIGRIVITTRAEGIPAMQQLAAPFSSNKPIEVIEGGAERQDSVLCGIEHLGAEYPITLIHDGARPLLKAEWIEAAIEACRQRQAVVCAQRAADTIKRATPDGRVLETLDRSTLWQMQTPQVFETSLITRAYRHVRDHQLAITDDASAVELLGHPVHLVETTGLNLKITRPADWELLELFLSNRA